MSGLVPFDQWHVVHFFDLRFLGVMSQRRFGLAASRPFLAFQVLFFVAAWLIPLISVPPDMTWITQSCGGGETGAASVGLPVVSLLRWLLAFSERNSLRRRGERCLAMWTPPSFLPSRSASSGICPGFCSRSPWLLRLSMTGDIFLLFYRCPGSGQDVFLGLALVFGQLLIEVPAAGELFYELVAENSEGGYGPGGLGFLQGGWPLKHEQWDAHLAVSFEGGP
ncbi:hypothetical protein F2Q69_00007100 [Brassica cretica]|uniref:Uncharacterized protein n=1 Tax=Brassica cretica TaxID=69181 RepID=A0A8S9NYP2_BRACR|nr:hypothetical protein F2Q69_00007100 [Brassica cretica]